MLLSGENTPLELFRAELHHMFTIHLHAPTSTTTTTKRRGTVYNLYRLNKLGRQVQSNHVSRYRVVLCELWYVLENEDSTYRRYRRELLPKTFLLVPKDINHGTRSKVFNQFPRLYLVYVVLLSAMHTLWWKATWNQCWWLILHLFSKYLLWSKYFNCISSCSPYSYLCHLH